MDALSAGISHGALDFELVYDLSAQFMSNLLELKLHKVSSWMGSIQPRSSEVWFFEEVGLCILGEVRPRREKPSFLEINVKRKELGLRICAEEVVSEGLRACEMGFEIFSSPGDSWSVMFPRLWVYFTVGSPSAVSELDCLDVRACNKLRREEINEIGLGH
jgi:hypothetical protein